MNSPILFSFHLFFLWSEFDKIYIETATRFVVSYFFEKNEKTKRTDLVQCIFANAFLLCADESASEPVGSSEILRKEGREKHGQTPHRGQRVVVFQHGYRVPGVPHRGLTSLCDPSSLQPHAAEPVVHVRFAFGRVAFRLHIPSRTGTGRDASAACFSGCQRVVRTGAGGRSGRKISKSFPIYWGSFVPPGLRVSGRLSVLPPGPTYRAPTAGDRHRPVHRHHQRAFVFSAAAGGTRNRRAAVFPGPFRQKKQRNRWFPKRRSQTICLFSVASGYCCHCSSVFLPPWIL